MHTRLCQDKRPLFTFAALILAVASSCTSDTEPALPQAFIAPATINVRSELNQKNSTVATLKHGEQVSIVDVRRRYVKIRSSRGAEGWVDSADLLRPQDMQRIQKEHADALKLQPEAAATAYENLNVHLDPSRASPAFTQVAEGGAVTVLARKITKKVSATQHAIVVFDKPATITRNRKKSKKKNSNRPPMPPSPKPPADWATIWGRADRAENEEAAALNKKNPAPPPIMEAWSLVRTKDNQTGWVLSRNLMMSIPDDVAQYAEGKHITSYFEIGSVNDEERGPKHDWLWTTSSGAENFDFDSWRVFIWNRRRHRYETSYRQRNIEGYFPVHIDAAEAGSFGRNFELIFKDDDGQLRRRTYLFDGTRVHLTATANYEPGEAERKAKEAAANAALARKQKESWFQKQWSALKQRLGEHQ